ncbi:hypothetical protein C5167_035158 [Papaver somniferum]|uniref:Uncharacterized protein n=1 Tax=Papaver somniferum TaxID=3469 RepID=A0A4Y7KJ86_PAPSO|nr:hypothetical protein C5167_035158 [Papaver somniferum]
MEELMTSIKKDPYLKTIIEEIETGGPTVMMRDYAEVGASYGFLNFRRGQYVCSVEHNAPNADAEDQTAKQA